MAAALVAALDHWSAVRRARDPKGPGWARRLAAARAADPDPDRDALRAALLVEDKAARLGRLRPLAERADAGSWAPASLVLLGEALADAGDADAGIAVLRRASWSHPQDARVHYALGQLLERVRPPQPEEAIRAYSLAWSRQPELAGHELAHALERRGRGAEAEAVWRDLVGRRPDDGRHLGCYGRHLTERGRGAEAAPMLDRAVAACREAIRLRPDDAVAHNNLGNALHVSGDRPGAIAEYREVIRLRPDDRPGPLQPRQRPGRLGRPARGDRRVPRGDPAETRLRRGPHQPRLGPGGLGRPARGDRGVPRGDPAEARPAPSPLQPRFSPERLG